MNDTLCFYMGKTNNSYASTLVEWVHCDHSQPYDKEMADFAKDAIDKFPTDERNFTGITMGIDDEDYEKILKELETCRKRIISIATAKKGGNRVYRLNLQMFPLTEKIHSDKTLLKK
jgi:uncharacterized protein (TIGR02147 family)